MRRLLSAFLVGLLLSQSGLAADRKGIRFWNLTSSTISSLHLSPAGQDAWGANQCANDPDGAVDHDERLKILGIRPGAYDVRLVSRAGRACVVRNIEIKENAVFSIADKDLTECSNQ